MKDTFRYPAGTRRLDYLSAVDGQTDWALYVPGDTNRNAVIYMHGSFSDADQLFERQDIRNFWLTRILARHHPLLSINMRGTSYMSPAATQDFTDLLGYCRQEYQFGKVVLLGGSGGASSAMAYACMHPEQIDGVIAMGMCDIFTRLHYARMSDNPVLQELVRQVFTAYGGSLEEIPEVYRQRSVLANIEKMTMPVVLTIGEDDALIPVAETRKIAEAMGRQPNFTYLEIPHGDHDSALWVDIDLHTLTLRQ